MLPSVRLVSRGRAGGGDEGGGRSGGLRHHPSRLLLLFEVTKIATTDAKGARPAPSSRVPHRHEQRRHRAAPAQNGGSGCVRSTRNSDWQKHYTCTRCTEIRLRSAAFGSLPHSSDQSKCNCTGFAYCTMQSPLSGGPGSNGSTCTLYGSTLLQSRVMHADCC
jgi:hypothetical protein